MLNSQNPYSLSSLTSALQTADPKTRDKLVQVMEEIRRRGTANRLSLHSKPKYEPYGAAKELQDCEEGEVIISGPSRTGKSRAALEKIHRLCSKYPGTRALFIRKTRESMNESVLQTFEDEVLGYGHPMIPNGARNSRSHYLYPNGSMIVVAGMLQGSKDQTAKIMSTEFSLIFVQEITELMEAEMERLTTRLTQFSTPYRQLIGDCNPDSPRHWVWVRSHVRGKTRLLQGKLTDNPRWWDQEKQEWTLAGKETYERLSSLTGVLREQLFGGNWVQAQGLIYGDVWNDGAVDGNVTEEAEYNPAYAVNWGVDDGYAGKIDPDTGTFTADSHPRAILLFQITDTGQIHVFAESYRVTTLTDLHIEEVLREYPYHPERGIHGPGAKEIRGRLQAAEIQANDSSHRVEEGIKCTRGFLAADSNSRRGLIVHPRCHNLRREMLMYRYDLGKETPVKQNDHGCDALRYICWTYRNQR